MSKHQTVLLFLATFVVFVVMFIALRPDDSDKTEDVAAPPATTSTMPAASPAVSPPATTPAEPAPPAPRPSYVQIRAKGLKPVGGVKTITANKGDTVRFEIRSDQPDEGHLHGYDISRPVGPGKRARYMFAAKIEGIFELELENAGVPIAELRVNP